MLLTASEKIHDPDARLRQLGLKRVLFGADLATGGSDGNPPPRQAWAVFRTMLPLTDGEFRTIAGNLAPYLRPSGGAQACATASRE